MRLPTPDWEETKEQLTWGELINEWREAGLKKSDIVVHCSLEIKKDVGRDAYIWPGKPEELIAEMRRMTRISRAILSGNEVAMEKAMKENGDNG